MLINKDARPADSIYYIACCIIEELKGLNTVFVDDGYYIIKEQYNKSLKYTDYHLALNFLFLIEKIVFKEGRLNYVH
ncbi:ABC-three component system middle component 6 [Peribacillus simplex]|uniref:ABC-three component system middle component 6 n=1 Tax=Peribacillus simplex TaxID=1478 RepID=UPI003D2C15C5